jgi:hypothetical protein
VTIGSGLGASLGFGAESTVGTAVTPTSWVEFNSESLKLTKNAVQGQGLRGGGLYPRSSRRAYTTRSAGGDINLDVATQGMGLLFKNMLGAGTSALLSGSAYQQVHTPASLAGQSLTVQKLVPQTDGTLKDFTYPGSKVGGWELACTVGGILTLRCTIDAKDEVTSATVGTPAYNADADVFYFSEGALVLGGTVTTAAGVASVTGGTTVAAVKGATITGTNPMKDDRYFLGASGTKAEQIENGWRTLGGNLDAEFTDQATIYDVFAADSATALKLTFTGTTAISGSDYPTLEVLIPSIRFEGDTPQVGGPDVVGISAGFTGLDDGTNAAVQIRYVTADTAI